MYKKGKPAWIMRRLLSLHPNNRISLKYLTKICKRLSTEPVFAGDYLMRAKVYGKTGRPRKLNILEVKIITDLLKDHRPEY